LIKLAQYRANYESKKKQLSTGLTDNKEASTLRQPFQTVKSAENDTQTAFTRYGVIDSAPLELFVIQPGRLNRRIF
jgi:hypothetical protein